MQTLVVGGVDESSAPLTTTYTYDAAGNLKTETLPNGVMTVYSYDHLNRLKHETVSAADGSTVIDDYAYQLNADGTRVYVIQTHANNAGTAHDQTLRIDYTYDALDRLTVESYDLGNNGPDSGDYTDTYTMDLVGNRLSKTHDANSNGVMTDSADETISYTYDARDRLTLTNSTLSGETDYTYDANGNTTSVTNADGSHTDYNYNLQNHLASLVEYDAADQVVHQIGYIYDASGTRVQSTTDDATTYFLADQHNPTGYSQIIEEKVGSADAPPTVSYLVGLDIIAQAKPAAAGTDDALTYFLYDGHGSVRGQVTPAGVVVAQYAYDAYGNPLATGFTNTASTELGYSGEWTEPTTGKQWLRARIYDVTTGRFMTRDTYQGNNSDPLTLHKYLYTNDDPVMGFDPSGHFTLMEMSVVLFGMALIVGLSGCSPSSLIPAFPTATGAGYFVLRYITNSLLYLNTAQGYTAGANGHTGGFSVSFIPPSSPLTGTVDVLDQVIYSHRFWGDHNTFDLDIQTGWDHTKWPPGYSEALSGGVPTSWSIWGPGAIFDDPGLDKLV